jgi:hypothetical protein
MFNIKSSKVDVILSSDSTTLKEKVNDKSLKSIEVEVLDNDLKKNSPDNDLKKNSTDNDVKKYPSNNDVKKYPAYNFSSY